MQHGTIVSWNDSRGYGFIKPDNENQSVFVHISAFGRLYKRPEVGDRVSFDTIIEQSGKQKAKIARIIDNSTQENDTLKSQSLKKVYHKPPTGYTQHHPGKKRNVVLVIFGLIVCVMLLATSKLGSGSTYPVADKTTRSPETTETPRFKCEGKVYYSEMSSYEEALFYLKNCPGTKMDGDNDGIPCEQQFNR
jgi:cold shock CspA family protein